LRGVEKSKFSPLYEAFRAKLVSIRKDAGLTQRQLAVKLRRVRTLVERIETGERRVDVVELYWICSACGADPESTFLEVAKLIKAADKSTSSSVGKPKQQK